MAELPQQYVAAKLTQIAVSRSGFEISGTRQTSIGVRPPMARQLLAQRDIVLAPLNAPGKRRVILRLLDLDIGTGKNDPGTDYSLDVHVNHDPGAQLTRDSKSYVGTIATFVHRHGTEPLSQDFDITHVVGANALTDVSSVSVVIAPTLLFKYLSNKAPRVEMKPFRVGGYAFLIADV